MTDPMAVVEKHCERYQTAVSNNDSEAYSNLFAEDAIRIPPGSEPEHGRDEIRRGEQSTMTSLDGPFDPGRSTPYRSTTIGSLVLARVM